MNNNVVADQNSGLPLLTQTGTGVCLEPEEAGWVAGVYYDVLARFRDIPHGKIVDAKGLLRAVWQRSVWRGVALHEGYGGDIMIPIGDKKLFLKAKTIQWRFTGTRLVSLQLMRFGQFSGRDVVNKSGLTLDTAQVIRPPTTEVAAVATSFA